MLDRWDKSIESLSSTLHVILPVIFPKTDAPPISPHPPNSISEKK
jgi:hypothetical protein